MAVNGALRVELFVAHSIGTSTAVTPDSLALGGLRRANTVEAVTCAKIKEITLWKSFSAYLRIIV